MSRLLLIEDDDATRELLALVLSRQGHEVSAVPSAEEGLARAAAGGFDLFLVDIGLPGLSGLEACRRLRGGPAGAGTPLILVTAEKRPQVKVEGLDSGADDYVVKPVKPAELAARVDALLRRYKKNAPSR